jgi:hypothetical protein
MAHTTGFYRVNLTYYFRCRVPSDLRIYFPGKGELKRTLRTKSLTDAKRLIKLWSAKAEKTFMMIRSGMLTTEQIKRLAEDWKRETLNDYEESRLTGQSIPRDDDDLNDRLDNAATF